MSGHSKWANIKRKKEAKDQQRGKLFSKLTRLITIAVVEGGGIGDPAANIRLRLATQRAREANMPKDNIQRAIEKAIGDQSQFFHEGYYEAFAPGAIGLIIHITTDNQNRASAEIRAILERMGGKLATPGSVNYLFKKCAYIAFEKAKNSLDDILGFAEAIESFDIEEDDEEGIITVYFPFENIGKVQTALSKNLTPIESSRIDFKPQSTIAVGGSEKKKIIDLVERLEEHDDVQEVYGNFEFID